MNLVNSFADAQKLLGDQAIADLRAKYNEYAKEPNDADFEANTITQVRSLQTGFTATGVARGLARAAQQVILTFGIETEAEALSVQFTDALNAVMDKPENKDYKTSVVLGAITALAASMFLQSIEDAGLNVDDVLNGPAISEAPPTQEEFEQHLAECPSCREMFEGLGSGSGYIRA